MKFGSHLIFNTLQVRSELQSQAILRSYQECHHLGTSCILESQVTPLSRSTPLIEADILILFLHHDKIQLSLSSLVYRTKQSWSPPDVHVPFPPILSNPTHLL